MTRHATLPAPIGVQLALRFLTFSFISHVEKIVNASLARIRRPVKCAVFAKFPGCVRILMFLAT